MDYAVTLLILAFMIFLVLFKAKYNNNSEHFFDADSTKTLRASWIFVIVMAHLDSRFHDPIQELILHFGYVGITFFFMSSGYGLSLSLDKKPDSIRFFWRKKLPKLVLACWLVTLIFALVLRFGFGLKLPAKEYLAIESWIRWLLACYFFFWLAHIFSLKSKLFADILCCIFVIIFSITVYFLSERGVITETVWVTECYGFIWGILLHRYRDKFLAFVGDKWIQKALVFLAVSAVLGLGYLKFKSVPLAGDYLLKIVLGASLLAVVLIINTRISFGNRISLFLGALTLETYLVHLKVIIIMNMICYGMPSGLFLLTAVLLTILLSVAVQFVLNLILKPIYKIPFMNEKGHHA